MADDPYSYEKRDHASWVTLNRPERRNALNVELLEGLIDCVERFEADPSAAVMVLTGAGTAFCSGMDLTTVGRAQQARRSGRPPIFRMERTKPLIAAVNGPAVGGGLELVLACDLAVAAESARFGLPEVKRGLIAAAGGVWRLPRIVGPRLANEMLLTGKMIDAERALSAGLVNAVVPDSDLADHVSDLAGQIAAAGPLAVRHSLRLAKLSQELPESHLAALTREASAAVRASSDAKEGVAAFLEKRAPVWTGR